MHLKIINKFIFFFILILSQSSFSGVGFSSYNDSVHVFNPNIPNNINLWKGNVLKINVYIGYFDGRENIFSTDNSLVHSLLSQSFTKKCDFENELCAFVKSGSLYTKTIKINEVNKKIVIEILNSDFISSLNDFTNNTNFDLASQKELTLKVRKRFLNDIKNEKIVFYIGHSLYGRGMLFGPRTEISESILDINEVLNVLNYKYKLKVLALLSCQTDTYYSSKFANINFIGTKMDTLSGQQAQYAYDIINQIIIEETLDKKLVDSLNFQ